MKLKTQLTLTVIVFLIILAVISSTIYYTFTIRSQISDQQDIAGAIDVVNGDLNYIANDYFLHQNPVQISNWESNISAIFSGLSQINSTNTQITQQVNTIRDLTITLNNTFYENIAYLQTAPEIRVFE